MEWFATLNWQVCELARQAGEEIMRFYQPGVHYMEEGCLAPGTGISTSVIIRGPFLRGELIRKECRLLPAKITRGRWSKKCWVVFQGQTFNRWGARSILSSGRRESRSSFAGPSDDGVGYGCSTVLC